MYQFAEINVTLLYKLKIAFFDRIMHLYLDNFAIFKAFPKWVLFNGRKNHPYLVNRD